MKIAVIGAGTAGLVAIKYSKSLGLDVTCFEQSSEIGGMWNYSETTEKDKNGLSIHSAMYKNLKTNFPSALMQFQDFEFSSEKNTYTTGFEMLNFLKSYAEHFKLYEHIFFEHLVLSVDPIEDDRWRIKVNNLPTSLEHEEIFDAVFVCNGHYFDPRIPEIDGLKYFKGEIMHSHDYRVPETYTGKSVLVLGGGSSGTDIAWDTSSTAKNVFFSHHRDKAISGYSKNVAQKPDVSEILPDGSVQFKDGTKCSVDVIIFCTGYNYKFPFLKPECNINVNVEDNHVSDLYKHIVNIHRPTMFFIGLPWITIVTFMMEFQIQFSLEFLLNTAKRPTTNEMLQDTREDIEKRKARGVPIREMHRLGFDDEMIPYFNFLANFANVPQLKSVYVKIAEIGRERAIVDPIKFRYYAFQMLSDTEYKDEITNTDIVSDEFTKMVEDSMRRRKKII